MTKYWPYLIPVILGAIIYERSSEPFSFDYLMVVVILLIIFFVVCDFKELWDKYIRLAFYVLGIGGPTIIIQVYSEEKISAGEEKILAQDAMNAKAIRASVTDTEKAILTEANAIRDSVTGARDTILAQDAMNAKAIRACITGARKKILAQDAMNVEKILARDSLNAEVIMTLLNSILKEQETIKESILKSEQDTSSQQ